ncbi:MAG: FkbM family methyltransferase [Bryobacterales bacterium]|nr:FkbM family methyltransferase [Bryobacterales bacterium]
MKTLLRSGYGREFLVEWARVRVAAGYSTAQVRTNGLTLTVNLQDFAIAGALYSEGTWEPAETAFVKAFLRPGMTVVDIGANLGYFTTLFASLVTATGKVIAFEPNPPNYGLLRTNIANNGLTHAIPLNLALGHEPGEAVLYAFDDNLGNLSLYAQREPSQATTVKVEPLDAVLAGMGNPPVDFIKIDIQGYEPYAFQGMTETLRRSPKLTILAEFWPWGIQASGADLTGYISRLASFGFRASILDDSGTTQPIGFERLATLVPMEQAEFANLILSKP